ncbi:class I SAM-dependent methyltransferase [Actinoplanes sp. TBRC 11911]|uniref:class I SAM-dependent methyltransferase n=1 Tax=Actinoplanes sp. TBRC 11911 TaxID=2729386 RepID=UPI00145FAF06|nr:methyltransferase domain-containing protein [Actinoplanes sp. TBRC 11911]NMO53932.1 class I SAM-dependent methyltransferase [Actinoplanes sp. TBRC 11911]
MTDKTSEFVARVVNDKAAASSGLTVSIGIRVGLYRAMAGAGPLTIKELAARTGLVERYVGEWLAAQVTSEYVFFDPGHDTYVLPDEHAAVLADPDSPVNATGGFTLLQALFRVEDALVEAFRSGDGVGWAQHAPDLFAGIAEFFRPGYQANLVRRWLPALDGVVGKLTAGAKVADVGSGFGHSTMLMAAAFPSSTFHGIDFHEPSVEAARREAAERGLADRVSFAVGRAVDLTGDEYDLVTFFDALHDMGDPVAVLRRVAAKLSADGTVMLVEPNTSANLLDNINPVGRSFAATSVALCLPAALAQNGPYALGNHAGEEVLRGIAAEAGLRTWRVAAETVANRVYEVKH